VPRERAKPAPFVGDAFTGDLAVTRGGTPALAHDGEPAGLARVTLAMRPPTRQTPAPGRLVGLCSWAAALGIAGLLLAFRYGVAVLAGAPQWFLSAAGITGLFGAGCTVGAFFAARRRIVPWVLLGAATCAIFVTVLLISLID
jgi:hypothetical protein